MEGVLAKKLTSIYRPGRRSPEWRKIKNIRTQEVVVAGWKPGSGRRSGTIGSLLLGIPEHGSLGYAGKVGTGFTAKMQNDLLGRLRPLARNTQPFGASDRIRHRRR